MTQTSDRKPTFKLSASSNSISDAVQLTDSQVRVAELAPTARVLVYGPPASGKTVAATELVSRLTQSNGPASVLAVAATRDAANNLRDRLALRLQTATRGPMSKTLTSLAFSIVREHALQQGLQEPELISGPEQDRIIKHVIAGYGAGSEAAPGSASFDSLGKRLKALGFPSYVNAATVHLVGFRSELRDLIGICLENGISPSDLERFGVEHGIQVWQGSSHFYRDYLEHVAASKNTNRYDSATLLRAAANLVGDSRQDFDCLSELRTLVIDDAQELTPAAKFFVRSLTRLHESNLGIIAIGDPDSSVLGFRFSDPRLMRELIEEVGATDSPMRLEYGEVFQLNSGLKKTLAQVSSRISPELAGFHRQSLAQSSVADESLGIELRINDSPATETAWLAHRMRKLHLTEGLAWKQIALVSRSGQSLARFESELAAENIPATRVGASSALRDEYASRALLVLIRQLIQGGPGDKAAVTETLLSPYAGFDNLELRRLRRALRKQELEAGGARSSDQLLAELFQAPGSAITLKTPEGFKLNRFIETYFKAQQALESGASVDQLLWVFWSRSEASKSWADLSRGLGEVANQANRNLDAVVSLFAVANRFIERNPELSVRDFVDFQLDLELPEDSLALNYRDDDRVSILTPSALIGRRFKVVFVVGLQDGEWPNLKPRTSLLKAGSLAAWLSGRIDAPTGQARAELDDELRMFYKSLGAASDLAILSCVEGEETQVSQFIDLVSEERPEKASFNEPQQTLRGLVGQLRRELYEAEGVRRLELLEALYRLSESGVPGARAVEWYGARPVSTEEPLTDLLAGELVYISPSQFEKFLQCPLHWFMSSHGARDGSFEANLGTLIHSALEKLDQVSEAALLESVESKWHQLEFESAWMEEMQRRKARKIIANLANYLTAQKESGIEVLAAEQKISGKLGDAIISGTVDRIERDPSGAITIVDLKTGKAHTPKSKADENAQMALYQLAFQNGGAVMVPGFSETNRLAGARLLFPLVDEIHEQSSLADPSNQELADSWKERIEAAIEGMAMAEGILVAEVNSHCNSNYSYGDCKLFLTEAVSFSG